MEKNKETSAKNDQMDYVALKNAAMVLRSVNHKLRQNIIKLLEENKRMMVTNIYVKLRIEQSVASQHLAILRRAGIVNTEREGKVIYYSLNYSRIDELATLVQKLVHE